MASSRGDDKKQRVVVAATRLFTRYGFKRTSLDLLASEAGVAKPTIYAYFEDKDAIFRAVVAATCDELLAAAERASRGRTTTSARLAAVLSAKLTRYWELVEASPHAGELVDSQGALGADAIARFDRDYLALLVAVIERAEDIDPRRVGLDPLGAARLFLRAASGASYDARTAAAHRRQLAEIVRVMVSAMRTG